MSHEVTADFVEARPTAVVRSTTTWPEFRTVWMGLLNEVYACLRANGITRGYRIVMLYLDYVPHVEVGVELLRPCLLSRRVVASTLPTGPVATTTHRGPYSGLGAAHKAVGDWCASQGRRPAGPRWEVYGPHNDDPSALTTEIYWLLSDDFGRRL